MTVQMSRNTSIPPLIWLGVARMETSECTTPSRDKVVTELTFDVALYCSAKGDNSVDVAMLEAPVPRFMSALFVVFLG